MNLDIKKKYEIVNSAVTHFGSNPFTIGELFLACEFIAKKYDIRIDIKDIMLVVMDLYDSFDLDRKIGENGVIRFQNSERIFIENKGSR